MQDSVPAVDGQAIRSGQQLRSGEYSASQESVGRSVGRIGIGDNSLVSEKSIITNYFTCCDAFPRAHVIVDFSEVSELQKGKHNAQSDRKYGSGAGGGPVELSMGLCQSGQNGYLGSSDGTGPGSNQSASQGSDSGCLADV